ncbi:hypothetical protein L1049_005864 [Liquidambar formosana]|uniref:Myb/SANT-like domain-containing protein n=1 Tax=Liquidambar formosana TaxID=63359 RepID=A0AAP0RG39_LIQFO
MNVYLMNQKLGDENGLRAITPDNIRHRVKLWKKYYGIVSDILAQSGFNWDASKQMITVDEDSAWKDYIKSHKDAKQFH